MKSPVLALALVLAAAGCGPLVPFVPDQAQLPAGALGGGLDPDVTAVNLAQYAFADSGRTYGRPVDAARACASMLYIAGALYTSPRWSNISAITKEQLLQGRQEVRDALGVAPGATAQQVVDGLVGAADALNAGDQAAAIRALSGPAFPAGGEKVLAVLSNLPYLRMANVSTMRAANQLFDNGLDDRF
jgi:hypothetical protein